MKKISMLIVNLTIIFQVLTAQEISPFQHFKNINPQDSSKLFFRFENLNFVKNNEYKGEQLEGRIWIGYLATPKLVYYPSKNFRIEAGARLQKYTGREDFTKSELVFSAVYKVSDKANFILGSLNQNNNHNLSEPIFEPERYFTDMGENGIQLKYQAKKLKFDTWINWEQFILENDPFQEKFTFGLSANWQLNSDASKNSLSIPTEIFYAHRGGEIDNSDEPVQTIGNFASGLEFIRKVENSRIKSWHIKTMAYYFSDNSSLKEFTFDKGHAFYPQISVDTKKSHLSVGYWNAYKFASSKGSELFRTKVEASEKDTETRNEMLTLNYYYEHKIAKGIHFGGKLDVYYDLNKSVENFATSVYLRINGDFFLKKIRWQ